MEVGGVKQRGLKRNNPYGRIHRKRFVWQFSAVHGIRLPKYSKYVLYALAGVLIIISTVWSADLTNTAFVLAFLLGIFLINRTKYNHIFLMLLGVLCVGHIINDFNVGPTSDLAKFTEVWPMISANGWMYIWLVFAVGITCFTLYRMTKMKPKREISRIFK